MSVENHPNVREAREFDEGPVGEVITPAETWIEERIMHVLSIYPKLSNSMLQVGVGTSLSPKIWKPVLQKMINNGQLVSRNVSSVSPDGRALTYTVISIGAGNAARPAPTPSLA
jgi:hypothetical protein